MKFFGLYLATLKDIATDRSGVLMLMLSILIYAVFYPAAYSHQRVTEMPLIVVDCDHSMMSRSLIMAAAATDGVEVAARAPSMAGARAALEAGRGDAILWIGPRFERRVLRGAKGDIAIFGNGAYLIRTRAALAALAAAIRHSLAQAMTKMAPARGLPAVMPVTLITRPLGNTRLGYGSAIVPGVLILVVHQTLLLGIGLMMATWRARFGRKMSVSVFFARAAAFFTIGCLGLGFFCGVAFRGQDYPRGGNLPALIITGPVYVAAVVMLGMLIGSFLVRRSQSAQLLLATSLPFFFLTGLSWPQQMVAPWLVGLSQLIPATSGFNMLLRLTQMRASLADVAPEMTILAVLALFFGLAAGLRLCHLSYTGLRRPARAEIKGD